MSGRFLVLFCEKNGYTPAMLERTVAVAFLTVLYLGAQPSRLVGDYSGMLGPYHVKLHVVAGAGGALTCSADNSDLNMLGMACSNLQVNGQTLSFGVPSVNGSWTGFVGADGNSLSGMWSQGGQPTTLNFTRATGVTPGTSGPPNNGEVKWDSYTFRFVGNGAVVQVFENGKLAGQIVTVNGQQRVMAMPGTDSAKLQKSYADYQTFQARSQGMTPPPQQASPVESATPSTPAAPAVPVMPPGATPAMATAGAEPKSLGFANGGKADPSGIKFDGNSVTVPRTDGMIVTIAGDDVTIGNVRGPQYVLRRKKASVGRAFEQAFDKRNAVGGGIAGGGIEFLRAGGGLIYDSGMGGYNVQESPGIRQAKQLALVTVDAIEAVRQVPGHESFKPSTYGGLKEVSQYRLRSDGSR